MNHRNNMDWQYLIESGQIENMSSYENLYLLFSAPPLYLLLLFVGLTIFFAIITKIAAKIVNVEKRNFFSCCLAVSLSIIASIAGTFFLGRVGVTNELIVFIMSVIVTILIYQLFFSISFLKATLTFVLAMVIEVLIVIALGIIAIILH